MSEKGSVPCRFKELVGLGKGRLGSKLSRYRTGLLCALWNLSTLMINTGDCRGTGVKEKEEMRSGYLNGLALV